MDSQHIVDACSLCGATIEQGADDPCCDGAAVARVPVLSQTAADAEREPPDVRSIYERLADLGVTPEQVAAGVAAAQAARRAALGDFVLSDDDANTLEDSRAGESLIGIRVFWPCWRASDRDTGIVRAASVSRDADSGWSLLVEKDDGRLCGVDADEATTRESP